GFGRWSVRRERSGGRRTPSGAAAGRAGLLRVQLDDELLADVLRDVLALREVEELADEAVAVDLQVGERTAVPGHGVLDGFEVLALGPDLDDVARGELVARDVRDAVVDHHVAVVDQLAGLAARPREAEAVDDVVEAGLEELEEVLAGDALLAGRLLEEVLELPLQQAVGVLRLLLLLELDGVLALLPAAGVAVLAGAVGFALERLGGAEDRFPESPRELLLGSAVTGHGAYSCVVGRDRREARPLDALSRIYSRGAAGTSGGPHGGGPARSDAAALRRPAAVVGDRRDVADGENLEAGVGEGAHGAFAARPRALDVHVDPAEAEVVGLLGRLGGGHLGRVRRVLPRPLEAHLAA